jgi:hypothetical protein
MSEAAQRVTEKLELLIPRRQIRSPRAPLAYVQERLWALYQLDPSSSALNISTAVRLEGKLDIAALKRAVATVVRRQEVLRTTFDVTADGRPFQSVHPPPSYWPLPLTDLRSNPLREAEVRRLVVAEAARPFKLETGPTFRTALICLSPDEHVLLLTLHHLIADDWSIGILLHEIAVLYAAFIAGTTAPLTNLPVQYTDFAVWQRQQKQIGNWQLTEAVQSFCGEREFVSLDETLSTRLQELGGCEGASLFMTLLAAFQLLLHRHSGEQDIPIGSNIANRNHRCTENLIGLFINDIVLHTDFSGNPTFRELLARARDVTLDAPPFQAKLMFQNNPLPLEVDGVRLSLLDSNRETSNCELHYNADFFSANTITHLLDRFQNLLHAIVADPDARIDTLC